jgi:hypothetical protein
MDVANFAIMHMNGGHFGNHRLLQRDTVETMQTLHGDAMTPTHRGYGLGWMLDTVNGRRQVGHDGSVSTFGSKLVMVPAENIGVILLFNRAAAFWNHADALCQSIINSLADASEATSVQPIEAPPAEYYTGTYLGYHRGLVHISIEDGQLMMNWEGQTAPLMAYQPDHYIYEGGSIGFIDDGDYLMLNGGLCHRFEMPSEELHPSAWASYAGTYGIIEHVEIAHHGDHLTAFHEEFGTMRCTPITNKTFSCVMGLLAFSDDGQMTLQGAYHLTKQ